MCRIRMPDENDAGASYLAALKRSVAPSTTPQAGGAAAAPAPEPSPAAGAPSGAATSTGTAEKRKSARYRCQGSAHIREIDSGVAMWTTFTDISLHGCYVEATTTYRVGGLLAMKLDANGYRVEATGEVRVAYPNLGMGISFTTMSEEDRERLRQLVRSISRPSVIMTQPVIQRLPALPQVEALPPVADPRAALQAMMNFFADRHIMGREEFLRILRNSQ